MTLGASASPVAAGARVTSGARGIGPWERAMVRAMEPVDIASLVAFRVAFGFAMAFAVARFFVHGWISEYFLVPRHFFHYYGFSWVRPWPGYGMHAHFALMGIAALGIMLGIAHRASCVIFGVLFTYAHFIDKTNYLNHYYLVSCLSFVLAALPLGDAVSASRARSLGGAPLPDRRFVPTWMLALVRFQIGVVYAFGGIAKLKLDWLGHAEPLTIWLGANSEFPFVGRFFHLKAVAFAASWAGAIFDLTVVPLLLWKRTRVLAFGGLVVFHLVTARLFQLGMFPWIMTLSATIFFDADWPRRASRLFIARRGVGLPPRTPDAVERGDRRLAPWMAFLIGSYVLWHVLVPFRHLLYPGNVLWTEQGFRFAWNVMLMEKNGAVELTVVDPNTGASWTIEPKDYLTAYQTKMMATQPDMLLEFAHVVADDFRQRGYGKVKVFADSRVSLNARPAHPLVDPKVDLAVQVEGFAPKSWLTPMPESPPEM